MLLLLVLQLDLSDFSQVMGQITQAASKTLAVPPKNISFCGCEIAFNNLDEVDYSVLLCVASGMLGYGRRARAKSTRSNTCLPSL